MSEAALHAHGHTGHDEGPLMAHGSVLQLGITNGKIATWLFLGSEVMFFTGLIGAYIVLRFGQPPGNWPDPSETLNVPLTAANTFLLICSSVTLVWGLQAIQAGDKRKGFWGLFLTMVFGAIFVSVQGVEYYELFTGGHGHRAELRPYTNLFGSCFYTMTGFHGFHVLCGVIAMAVLTVKGFLGHFDEKHYAAVELTGLYWHFVDLVWIILFAIVYLM
jgi:cytochrome c oxidase subunit III